MESATENFPGLRSSPELVRDIAAQLLAWSAVENEAILAAADGVAIAPMGLTGDLQKIQAGEPIEISVRLDSYTKGGRQYSFIPANAPSAGPNQTVDSLLEWMEQTQPDSFTAILWSRLPRTARVTLNAAETWTYAEAKVEGETGYVGVPFTSEADPALFLDPMKDALAPHADAQVTVVSNRVFLGHGWGSDWQMLQQAIEQEGFEPIAFETISAAGVVNFHGVDAALRGSFAAVVHMSPDDEMKDGTKRARQNVIHEIGLAQGILGVTNVIIVHNVDTVMPSNLDGVTVVKYATGDLFSKLDEVKKYLQAIRKGPIGGGYPYTSA